MNHMHDIERPEAHNMGDKSSEVNQALAVDLHRLVRRFRCWWRGKHSWQKLKRDSWRGIVCGLSYFEICDCCGKERVAKGCAHETCTQTIAIAAWRGDEVIPAHNIGLDG